MKSVFLSLIAVLVSTQAFAAGVKPASAKDNQKALAILIAKSASLTDQDGKSVAVLLSKWLVTSDETHNKVSNTCVKDSDDLAFKCELMIVNADDKAEGRTESSIQIQYQLEIDKNGSPSADLFYMSVTSMIAG